MQLIPVRNYVLTTFWPQTQPFHVGGLIDHAFEIAAD